MEPLFKYVDWDFDEYTIFEPGERFIKNAEAIANNVGKNINFINRPFDVDNETSGLKYDAIICSQLLHEVQNPSELLESIYFTADLNTLIHINVPNANSFHRLLAKEMNLILDTKQFSERNIRLQQNAVFDLQELNKICVEAGFTVYESGSYFVKPFTHEQMKRMMDEKIIDLKVLDGLYSMIRYIPNMGSEIYVNCRKN